MEIQVGSLQQPVILKPRINGIPVTVSDIKNSFSNFYVSDGATPIDWKLEYKTRTGAKTLIAFDASRSTNEEIWFLPADAFYATEVKYTIMFYWTISTEKVYSENAITFDIKEIHNEP